MTTASHPDLDDVRLDLTENEASGLLRVDAPGVLASHGWRTAFWVCLDDVPAEESVALVGVGPADASGDASETDAAGEHWHVHRMEGRVVGDDGRTEDAEAVARHDGWIYVVGSHYGGKDGPLQARRQFVARFREDAALPEGDPVNVEVSLNRFALHRLVVDALHAAGVELAPYGPALRDLVDAKVSKAIRKDKDYRGRVRQGDHPLNVEGASFRPSGELLLGLRYPVAADGTVLVVRLGGVEGLFDERRGLPEVVGVWQLDVGASPDLRVGARDLEVVVEDGTEVLHLLVGNLDSKPEKSLVLADHPEGVHAHCSHHRVTLDDGAGRLTTERVRDFQGMFAVEGLAQDPDGAWVYVSDEDDAVHTRFEPAARR